MSSLVAASSTLTQSPTLNDCRQSFVMGDGKYLALYGSPLTYKTSVDGITWSSGTSTGITAFPKGCVQNGNTLYMVALDGSGNLIVGVLAYASSALTATTYNLGFSPFATGMSAPPACAWDSSHSVLHIVIEGTAGAASAFYIGAWSPTSHTVGGWTQISPYGTTITDLACVSAGTSTLYVVTNATSVNPGAYVLPLTYSGSAYSAGGVETAATGSMAGIACSLNASNNLDLVYASGGQLYARTRTGSNVYGVAANIAGAVNSGDLSLVPNSNDLYAFYESVANSVSEIYVVQRKSGTWGTPTRVAGGDGATYTAPKVAPALSGGNYALLYQRGSDVYYGAGSQTAAPSAPTITVSQLTSLTPTFSGNYTNASAPSDPQGGREVKVTRNSDSHVMWDSGMMSAQTSTVYGVGSNTGDANYVAPQALSFSVAYTVTVRDEDSQATPKLVGAWSSGTTFTLVQGGTIVITSLVDNGTTSSSSPATITAATFDSITASWTQPQSHSASQYQDTLTDAGGAVVAQTPATTIPGGLASGSSYTSGSWAVSGLANSSTYSLTRAYLDSVSGLWSYSAAWTITTAWTPPPAPTSFSVLWVAHPGYSYITWANPGAASTVLLERSLAGANQWVTIYSGSVISTLSELTPYEQTTGWDWRVSVFDSQGIQSAYATQNGVLATPDGIFGASLVDSTNSAVWCHFGPVNDWKQASTFDEPTDRQEVATFGALRPTVSRRYTDYSQSKQKEFAVPPDGPYFAGGQEFYQIATLLTFRAMGKSGNAIWYRDTNEPVGFYVEISNVQRSIGQDGEPMRRLQWDMVEIDGPGGPTNPRMPYVLAGVTGPALSPDGSVSGNFIPGTSWPGG